jgi:hypothetical protein
MVYYPLIPLPVGYSDGWWGVENKIANVITDTPGLKFDVTILQVATGAAAITDASAASAAAAGAAAAGAAASAASAAASGAIIAGGDFGSVALGIAGGAFFFSIRIFIISGTTRKLFNFKLINRGSTDIDIERPKMQKITGECNLPM